MAKIHLDKIESELDAQLVAEGGDLIASGQVASGLESEKNLWLFKIEDTEVEVQTYGRKVKSFTCECSEFFKVGVCKHSVAAFLEIRKRKDAPKLKSKIKKSVNASPKKMTVSVILKEAETSELIQFIGEYARRDQQFTNALKIRFATKVEAVNLKEKYAQLLYTIIRSNRSANQSFTRNGARKIFDMTTNLLEQIEDESRAGNYVEVFEAAKNIIEKITPVFDVVTAHLHDLQSVVERSYRLILRILEDTVSPDLRLSIAQFFTTCIRQRYFNYNKLDKLFLTCLLKAGKETDPRLILTQCLDSETIKNYHNREIEAKIYFYFAVFIEKFQIENAKYDLVSRIEKRPWLMRNLVDVAVEMKRVPVVKFLTDEAFKMPGQAKNKERFDEFRFKIAIEEQSPEDIALFAARRLISTLEISYYSYFRNEFKPQSKEVKAIIKRLENLPDSKAKFQCLAGIYSTEEMGIQLFNLIENSDENFELLKKHSAILYKLDKTRAKQVIWTKINGYLQNHLGVPAAIFVRNFIRDLYGFKADRLAKYVKFKIGEEYESRKSLMDEIFIFR